MIHRAGAAIFGTLAAAWWRLRRTLGLGSDSAKNRLLSHQQIAVCVFSWPPKHAALHTVDAVRDAKESTAMQRVARSRRRSGVSSEGVKCRRVGNIYSTI